eukprot:2551754-Amphidinium_carterae.1
MLSRRAIREVIEKTLACKVKLRASRRGAHGEQKARVTILGARCTEAFAFLLARTRELDAAANFDWKAVPVPEVEENAAEVAEAQLASAQ